jgi:NAD(P)-dependent dehydrogenase (short-subunit alcohol dehydrogenase family)
MTRFEDSTVMVTGAGSGIGRAMAEGFSSEGATVLVVDIDAEAAQSTVEALGAGAVALEADVADPASVATLFEQVERVDVLCNNAGIFDEYKPAAETEVELWDRVIGVNLRGPFLVSAAAIPGMIAAGGGAIVNTASIAAKGAGGGGAAYTASKHGLLGLTRQLAFDYGRHGIRVNALCPGVVATPMSDPAQAAEGEPAIPAYVVEGDEHIERVVAMTPARRWAQPSEMASVAMFLASDQASFLHGAAVMADGGWTLI